jgi:hypothetical protein
MEIGAWAVVGSAMGTAAVGFGFLAILGSIGRLGGGIIGWETERDDLEALGGGGKFRALTKYTGFTVG